MEMLSFVQMISERKKQLIIGSISVFAGIAILSSYFSHLPNAENYADAEEAFASWEASPADSELYDNMKNAIRSVPILSSKYEPTIVQKFINTERLQEALVIANRSLLRVKDDVPFHALYGQNTLLIEQGHFQKALENAVALKEEMGHSIIDEHKAGALLYIHNLLRIACLQQELMNNPGEQSAWEELETFLEKEPHLSQIFVSGFTQNEANLFQYIQQRKKQLSQKL